MVLGKEASGQMGDLESSGMRGLSLRRGNEVDMRTRYRYHRGHGWLSEQDGEEGVTVPGSGESFRFPPPAWHPTPPAPDVSGHLPDGHLMEQ